jgi:collagenase-like PrtC family protease
VIVQESKDLRETIARLNERLDEPFVTVNTVTGDNGIKQAQDEYQRLMNNKSSKKIERMFKGYDFCVILQIQ